MARKISFGGVAKAGILRSIAGKVQLLHRSELEDDWDPGSDKRLCVWEATQQLIKRLEADGESSAASLLLQLKGIRTHGDLAANCRALAYRSHWPASWPETPDGPCRCRAAMPPAAPARRGIR